MTETTWTPRLAAGQAGPETLGEWYALACSEVYADTGIQAHLPYMADIAHGKRIVELGIGGGDQSTLAWLVGTPVSLDCYDVNPPPSLPTLQHLAGQNGIAFVFHHGHTANADLPDYDFDILFVDSLHNARTVATELQRFAPLCRERIVFHDVLSFGCAGQDTGRDQGINLAIAEFLYEHPEWRVERFSRLDNGLLTLRRELPGK